MKKVVCDYCGKQAEYIDSKIIYGKSYGMIYYCEKCNAWVGVHKGTNIPLGRLADAHLRLFKKQAHNKFDKLWKNKIMSRSNAYKWLAKKLNINVDDCHIGMFDANQCRQVIRIMEDYENE